jgi:hypothetical protein
MQEKMRRELMSILLFGEIEPATANIQRTLSKISEEIQKLEYQCIDSCLSCRNLKAKTLDGSVFSMQIPQCAKEHWVHHADQICCDGRYYSQYNYVPTQEFLKLKIKVRRYISKLKEEP